MNFGFTHSNTNLPNHTVNAYHNRDQFMSQMGYKGSTAAPVRKESREVFDPKTIVMPKMVVKNAP